MLGALGVICFFVIVAAVGALCYLIDDITKGR